MTRAEFLNAMRILNSLDRNEVKFLSPAQWIYFARDPLTFLSNANDDTADQIWAAIEKRS